MNQRLKGIICFFLFFFDCAFSLSRSDFSVKEEILQLDESNWQNALETFDYLLVEFMATWCSACQNLQPEYEKAAKALLQNNPPIHLAAVDASKNGNLYQKYVKGYPTMKFFINGDALDLSLKTLKEQEILDFVHEKTGPGKSKLINSIEQLEEFNRTNQVLVIYFGKNDENYKHFETLTKQIDTLFYGHTFDPEIAKYYEIDKQQPTVVLFKKKSDEARSDFTGLFNLENLEHFVNYNRHGLIMRYTSEVKDLQEKEQKDMLVLLYKKNMRKLENWEQLKNEYKAAALELNDKILFGECEVDSGEGKTLAGMLGVNDDELPAIRIFKIQRFMYEKYRLDKNEDQEPLNKQKVLNLFNQWKTKKLTSYQKSAKPPTQQGIILEVTGNTWNEIVGDRTKDVLLLYYTNGCGECSTIENNMKKVAKKLSKVAPDLVFAKINMSDNESPDPFLTQGYPDIRFHTTRRKSGPALCKKPYDSKSLEKYVKQRVTVSWDESELKKKSEEL